MYSIKTMNKIAACGTDLLDKSKYVFGDNEENPDAILVRSASLHEMEFGDKLLAIARAGAGVNNIPVDACTEKGIAVFNTPGANANAVKELVIMGILMSSRKVTDAIDWAKTLKGKGDEVGKLVEKGKSQFAGPEIKGKKLGVIGLGAIGALVANAANDLGMEVWGADPFLSLQGALHLSTSIKYVASNKEIFENCDYITLHVPLLPDTKNLINAQTIATMKDGVRIMNFARGGLADEKAVIDALGTGKVAAYVTDFPSDDVIGVPGVIAIPHLGASTPESEDNCAVMAVHEIIDYIEKGNIVNSVNLPNVTLPKTGDAKICVIHKNVEGALTKITGCATDTGLNIENMANASKKEYSYTVLDVTGNADGVEDKINALDSVISVRVIK